MEEFGKLEARRGGDVEQRNVNQSQDSILASERFLDKEGKVRTPQVGLEKKDEAKEYKKVDNIAERKQEYVKKIVGNISDDLLNEYNELVNGMENIRKLNLRGQEILIEGLIRKQRKKMIESIGYEKFDGPVDFENDRVNMYKGHVLSNNFLFVYDAWNRYGNLFDKDMYYVVGGKLIGSVGIMGSNKDTTYYVVYVDKKQE